MSFFLPSILVLLGVSLYLSDSFLPLIFLHCTSCHRTGPALIHRIERRPAESNPSPPPGPNCPPRRQLCAQLSKLIFLQHGRHLWDLGDVFIFWWFARQGVFTCVMFFMPCLVFWGVQPSRPHPGAGHSLFITGDTGDGRLGVAGVGLQAGVTSSWPASSRTSFSCCPSWLC